MRDVNFSMPSSNKASVGITTALYDRRALDCTSTLPLINSLNHLCYLTQSSARIREILTVDGGIERLVCVLKNGRSRDILGTWKWNLALQCVYNIGVRGSDVRGPDTRAPESRGSENIRMRVVEADIVPVLATILDNYIQVVQRVRRHEDDGVERSRDRSGSRSHRYAYADYHGRDLRSSSRREAPPPITIPNAPIQPTLGGPEAARLNHHRRHVSLPGHMMTTQRDAHPTGLHAPEAGAPPMTATSQPDTPVSPRAPHDATSPLARQPSSSPIRTPRRPSIRHQHSTSAMDSEDDNLEAGPSEPLVEIQTTLDGEAAVELEANEAAEMTTANEPGIFNITHRSADGSIFESNNQPPAIETETPTPAAGAALHFSPDVAPAAADRRRPTFDSAQQREQMALANQVVSVPRDEDVIMSLQLLAYVSKYSDLRSYFQRSHLVPRLKIARELNRLRPDSWVPQPHEEELEEVSNDDEYCQPDDYNIFPLIERFTLRYHAHDMKYWASIVLRNLCRKDRNRGDIRQCAYYKCGRWEDYAKQFAKCRRCRQTKYCSKECQKSAWTLHRFWCTEPCDPIPRMPS